MSGETTRSRQESRLGKAQQLAIEQSSILCTNSDLEKDRLKGKCNRQRDEQPDLHVISKNKARKETDDAEAESIARGTGKSSQFSLGRSKFTGKRRTNEASRIRHHQTPRVSVVTTLRMNRQARL